VSLMEYERRTVPDDPDWWRGAVIYQI